MKSYFSVQKNRKLRLCKEFSYLVQSVHPTRVKPDFHDFVYIIEGTFDFIVNGEYYQCSTGDVFILPAGSTYSGKHLCSPELSNIFIHADVAEGDITFYNDDIVTDGKGLVLESVIHCQGEPLVYELFRELSLIGAEIETDKSAPSLFDALLCILSKRRNSYFIKNIDIIEKCLSVLNENKSKIFRESEMASLLNISDKKLRNIFVDRFGKTFSKYQMDNKLSLAYTMILNYPQLKLYEIASLLGFCDEFHMSKLFKAKFGYSPIQCRLKNNPDKENKYEKD